jgi:hypothetical protein
MSRGYLYFGCGNRLDGWIDLAIRELERNAINAETPVLQLWELAQHSEYTLRQAVAQNPHVPLEILEQLVEDPIDHVVRQVLKNPRTSLKILLQSKEFNQANKWRLRFVVAESLKTSVDVLSHLAEDDSEFVRYAISRNPNTPKEIAAQAGDPNYFQQLLQIGATGNNQKQLENLSTSYSTKIRKAVAINPNTPRRVMEVFTQDRSYQVRRILARNKNAPDTVLETLASDRYSCVRVSVAANPKTPRTIRVELCQDRDSRVQRVAVQYWYYPKTW